MTCPSEDYGLLSSTWIVSSRLETWKNPERDFGSRNIVIFIHLYLQINDTIHCISICSVMDRYNYVELKMTSS